MRLELISHNKHFHSTVYLGINIIFSSGFGVPVGTFNLCRSQKILKKSKLFEYYIYNRIIHLTGDVERHKEIVSHLKFNM